MYVLELAKMVFFGSIFLIAYCIVMSEIDKWRKKHDATEGRSKKSININDILIKIGMGGLILSSLFILIHIY